MATALMTETMDRIDHAVDASRAAFKTIKRHAQDLGDLRHEVVHRVRREPMKAVGIAFGAGLVTGIATTLLCRSRRNG